MTYRPQAVTIDDRAVEHLVEFCQANGLTQLFMVADKHTYAAQGQAVESALRGAGFDLKQIVFTNEEVIADAAHVFDVLIAAGGEARTYVAVGSGTLTDITRFASHRSHSHFLSVPTAPSVDGFASIGAPLIIHGVKISVYCQAPYAIFADINTLAHAPQTMIAAGFGDMLGKLTSIADWRLGRLLWNEPYDEAIAQRTLDAVQICVDNVDAIGHGAPEGISRLLDALLESGYCMLDFGESRPASGAEHHTSHYWEMKLLREGRPAILHGAKVGVATVMVAELYDRVRRSRVKRSPTCWKRRPGRRVRRKSPALAPPTTSWLTASSPTTRPFSTCPRRRWTRSSAASWRTGMRFRPSQRRCHRRPPSPICCSGRAGQAQPRSWALTPPSAI
jgi:glycerol-1-phosphate dehydrogenase [NAD(P)+]